MSDSTRSVELEEMRDRYLELLGLSLTHLLYAAPDAIEFTGRNPVRRRFLKFLRERGIVPVRILSEPKRQRLEGRDWPMFAQTMVGLDRLRKLRGLIETVIADQVPGDVIETGVWRGGASIFTKGVLKAHGVEDRTVWAADSFEGLPRPDGKRYPADSGALWHTADFLAVGLDEVKENFRRYGLLDDRVRFLEGWFRDTLPTVRDRTWALVRLDGDMYESTMDGLTNLYPGLAPGGFLVVDDYSVDSCRDAVDDFRRAEGIREPLERIDWTAVCWRRSA